MPNFERYNEEARNIINETYSYTKELQHNPISMSHLVFVLINKNQ